MKRNTKIEILVVLLIVVLPACGWLLSEMRWSSINTPNGRFANVREYIEHGRQPSRVVKVEKEGKTFFIAHSPMDTWLAVPSGPAAYVFNEAGQMLEWSRDMGDDPSFQKKWPLPHKNSSLEELKRIGFQQGAEGDALRREP